MTITTRSLSPEARLVVGEEEALLERSLASIARAGAKRPRAPFAHGLRSVEELRALREEATAAAPDDLPALLLEMSVRRKLLDRPAEEPLPDPGSPYLAHLKITEGRGDRDYLLGHTSYVAPEDGVRIVDWRVAPVARIFYRHREGDEYEETFPGREIEGTVVCRRILVITGGVLARIIGDDMVLARRPDGDWMSEELFRTRSRPEAQDPPRAPRTSVWARAPRIERGRQT